MFCPLINGECKTNECALYTPDNECAILAIAVNTSIMTGIVHTEDDEECS